VVERDEAVSQLPVVYQRVLAWLAEGWSGDQIADGLGIDRQAVDPLIRLSEAKLARLTDDSTDEETTTTDVTDRGPTSELRP
jgi:hypothetical protein